MEAYAVDDVWTAKTYRFGTGDAAKLTDFVDNAGGGGGAVINLTDDTAAAAALRDFAFYYTDTSTLNDGATVTIPKIAEVVVSIDSGTADEVNDYYESFEVANC